MARPGGALAPFMELDLVRPHLFPENRNFSVFPAAYAGGAQNAPWKPGSGRLARPDPHDPLFSPTASRERRGRRPGNQESSTRPGPHASIFPAVYAGWTTGRALEARERPPPPVQARMPPVFPLRPAGGTENACRNARKRPPCPPKAQKRAPPLPRTADGRRPLPPEKGGSLLQMRHVRRGASVGIEQAVAQVEQLVGEVHLVHVGVALAGVLFPQAGQLFLAAGLNLQ